MKKLIISILFLSGCQEFSPTTGAYTVLRIESLNNTEYRYTLDPIMGIRGVIYLRDTTRYRVGDTLILVKKGRHAIR